MALPGIEPATGDDPRQRRPRRRRMRDGAGPDWPKPRSTRQARAAGGPALHRDAEHLGQGRLTQEHLGQSVTEHGTHARGRGRSPDGPAVLPLHDPRAHLISDLEELEDAHAPPEAAAPALQTALAPKRAGLGERIGPRAEHALLAKELDGVLVVRPRAQELHGRLVAA